MGQHLEQGPLRVLATVRRQFGYFQFGGSDIILLLQAGLDPRIDMTEGFRHVGEPVATTSVRHRSTG